MMRNDFADARVPTIRHDCHVGAQMPAGDDFISRLTRWKIFQLCVWKRHHMPHNKFVRIVGKGDSLSLPLMRLTEVTCRRQSGRDVESSSSVFLISEVGRHVRAEFVLAITKPNHMPVDKPSQAVTSEHTQWQQRSQSSPMPTSFAQSAHASPRPIDR
jgi:hypothetical protein